MSVIAGVVSGDSAVVFADERVLSSDRSVVWSARVNA